jgi:hypothetical protein
MAGSISERTRCVILLAALFADPVDLKGVTGGEIVIFAADLLLELANFLREKFDRAAAIRANHVVMAAAIVLVLVTGNAVVKGDFAGQATLCQQFQGAVDRGVADAGIFFLDEAVEFVGGKMIAGFQERAQDRVALLRLLEADALQMLVKYFLGLADHLAGQGRLIIDALLEHGGGTKFRWSEVRLNLFRISSGILKMKFIFNAGPGRGAVEYNRWNRIKDSS